MEGVLEGSWRVLRVGLGHVLEGVLEEFWGGFGGGLGEDIGRIYYCSTHPKPSPTLLCSTQPIPSPTLL